MQRDFDIIVIGGGHAGAEAAWAAANMLRAEWDDAAGRRGRVALVTMDPSRIGQMSCNPAIGGLAKGQIVREIDAMGGLMGLAADATGIQFRVLNQSKGPAVRGPRCQSDKYAYALEVQRLLHTRANLTIVAGAVEGIAVDNNVCQGVILKPGRSAAQSRVTDADAPTASPDCCGDFTDIAHADKSVHLNAPAVVLTTGTFMRGLMHTGSTRTPGGRVGEQPAVGISRHLQQLGFELGRLKTGTPPRLAAESIDWHALETQPGDDTPTPFSDMSQLAFAAGNIWGDALPVEADPYTAVRDTFPVLDQIPCHITHTTAAVHDRIRDNLDRAPMYNGQIDASSGPRYCPSIEDKVVRFADKQNHNVFLEPESLSTNEVYCNGISTSLPTDVQDYIVANLPGCERAKILRYGYAVEYDMVWPHQIDATCMTKLVPGLFLAGQINGTTGYEEAAGQGLIAGINAVLHARGDAPLRLRRDQAYIGVLMDDLVTKVPREPYRMFTSRAEHRLLLRADNTPERLTPLAHEFSLIDAPRWSAYQARQHALTALRELCERERAQGLDEPNPPKLIDYLKRPNVTEQTLAEQLACATGGSPTSASTQARATGGSPTSASTQTRATGGLPTSVSTNDPTHWRTSRQCHPTPLPALALAHDRRIHTALLSEVKYAGFIERHHRQHQRLEQLESHTLPTDVDYHAIEGMRTEARHVLDKFRPTTLGQAGRLAGITPADLTVLSFALNLR